MDRFVNFECRFEQIKRKWRIYWMKSLVTTGPQVDKQVYLEVRHYLEAAKQEYIDDPEMIKKINELQYELEVMNLPNREQIVVDNILLESKFNLEILRRRNKNWKDVTK